LLDQILVTDDNSVNRIVTKRLLDKLGCRTTLADSGERCLLELAKPGADFKILFLDLCMPIMDGYEVSLRTLVWVPLVAQCHGLDVGLRDEHSLRHLTNIAGQS
jgi:PleD family two-component response regulator